MQFWYFWNFNETHLATLLILLMLSHSVQVQVLKLTRMLWQLKNFTLGMEFGLWVRRKIPYKNKDFVGSKMSERTNLDVLRKSMAKGEVNVGILIIFD